LKKGVKSERMMLPVVKSSEDEKTTVIADFRVLALSLVSKAR